MTGLQSLLDSVPDFFEIVQHFGMAFERRVGRSMRISVFDFGQPYWIDAGNHVALSRAFADLFSDSQSGAAIRAFLGLPDSISAGANFIADSSLPIDHKVENSIVIGTKITGKGSSIQGAVVLGSNIGYIIANHGASVIWCRVDDLRVDGPNGIAFRLDGPQHVVLGDESATTLCLGDRILNLKYSRRIGNIDPYIFERRLPGNPVSFSEAASLVKAVDPIELHHSWMARLARVQLAGIALFGESEPVISGWRRAACSRCGCHKRCTQHAGEDQDHASEEEHAQLNEKNIRWRVGVPVPSAGSYPAFVIQLLGRWHVSIPGNASEGYKISCQLRILASQLSRDSVKDLLLAIS